MQIIIAIDPGRDKCGLAVVSLQGEALQLELAKRRDLLPKLVALIDKWQEGYAIKIVIGNGTEHKQVLQELVPIAAEWQIQIVEEYGTTLAARDLYWQHNKAKWWEQLIPEGWRSTPPLDAYAAWAIAKVYIKCYSSC